MDNLSLFFFSFYCSVLENLREVNNSNNKKLFKIAQNDIFKSFMKIKSIEAKTNHDL